MAIWLHDRLSPISNLRRLQSVRKRDPAPFEGFFAASFRRAQPSGRFRRRGSEFPRASSPVGLLRALGVVLGGAGAGGIHFGEVVLRANPPEDVARGAEPLEVGGSRSSVSCADSPMALTA